MTPIFDTLQRASYETECSKSIAVGVGGWEPIKKDLTELIAIEITNTCIDARCRADDD